MPCRTAGAGCSGTIAAGTIRRMEGRLLSNRTRQADAVQILHTVLGEQAKAVLATFILTAAVLVALTALLPGVPGAPNRPAGIIIALIIGIALIAVVSLSTWGRRAPAQRLPFSLLVMLAIAVSVWATGGAYSPVVYLFFLDMVFIGLLYPSSYIVLLSAACAVLMGLPLLYDPRPGFLRLWLVGAAVQAIITWLASKMIGSLEHQARQNRHLKVLAESAKMLTNLQLEETLSTAVQLSLDATGADSCQLFLLEPDDQLLRAHVVRMDPKHYGPEIAEMYRSLRVPVGQGMVGWVAQHGQAVNAGDSERDPRSVHMPGTEVEDASAILAPLRAGERVTGLIRASRKGLHQFSAEDLQLLEVLAGQAAVAIENARLYERTNEMAITDSLTGLFNRRYLNRVLENELMQSASRPIALLMIDVYDFKKYNDSLGHLAGDKLLQEVARLLQENTRGSDVVVRYGGDEFVILMPDATLPEAQAVKNRIDRALVHTNLLRNPGEPPITLNIGLDAAKARDIHQLLVRADNSMYEAKRSEDRKRLAEVLEATVMEREKHAVQAVLSLAKIQELKDPYTRGHSERARRMAMRVARELGLSDEEVQNVGFGAVLHDVGKIVVPPEIINKPGPLTEDEWRVIRSHPEWGANIVGELELLAPVKPIILHHQERFDGDIHNKYPGYPLGLQGDQIPIGARIIAVVDAFDAMTSDRSYRKGMPKAVATEELRRHSGKQFDPRVVEAFIRVLGQPDMDIPHIMQQMGL